MIQDLTWVPDYALGLGDRFEKAVYNISHASKETSFQVSTYYYVLMSRRDVEASAGGVVMIQTHWYFLRLYETLPYGQGSLEETRSWILVRHAQLR